MEDRRQRGVDGNAHRTAPTPRRRFKSTAHTLALGLAFIVVLAGVQVVAPTAAHAATPAFVQARANEVTSGTTNAQAFTSANTAGNLIAAYVIWNNAGAVTLADTRLNTYTAATARVSWGSNWSAQVFYAKNIAGGTNTVTATFGTAINQFGIVYLHEYSGLNKVNPVDVIASATGTAAAMSSGAVATTNASDLLFAAGASSKKVTQAGSGYTTRSTAFDNRTEDRVVTTTGSYAGTATQNGNAWVMQLVAFRADAGTGDGTPPTVAITAPTGGSVSGSVTVTANASDNTAVAAVQFLLDGNNLGAADTTSPYSIPWDTTTSTNGTHTLTARATDTSGNTATSTPPVSVTVANVDGTPPTVAITAPTGGSVSGSVTVTANASDNVAVANVQFLLDGNNLGAPDTTSPYSVAWDTTTTTNAVHTLSARATDTSGNTTTSTPPVSVTVSNTVATGGPAFVQARANEVTSGTTNAQAFTSANTAGNLIAAYVIWNNAGAVTLADTRLNTYTAATARVSWGSNWSAQVFYAKNIAGGTNTVTATFGTAITQFGIVYLHEYSGLNKVNPVDVIASATGTAAAMSSGAVSTTNASDLLFAAGASSASVTQAGSGYTTRSTAFDNRTEDRVVTTTGSYAGTATQNGNAWVMQLVAFRADAGTGDGTPPTVAITAPTGGSVSGSVTVTANASDNTAVAAVQFLLDGNNLGAADTTSPYSTTWDTTTTANGTHTLTARATDTSGNATTSTPPVSVTVANAVISGPVAAYAFNEGTGTTTADASGDSLTGTLVNGPTWTTGEYGSAVSFDGVNDVVDLGNPTPLQLTGSMTLSGWINSASFPTGDAAVVSKKTVDGTGYQLDTTVDSGPRTIGFKLTNSSGADMIRYGATPLQLNTWYDIAGVYNTATQTIDVYLNGVLDNGALVGTATSSQQNSTANVSIGQRVGDPSNFNGRIDEVRLYNRALTAPQIQADMNTPVGGWTTYLQGNGHTGFAAGENAITPATAPNLHLAWQASDSGQPESGVFAEPIVANGNVYWGSFDGYERATDTAGHLVWQTFLGHTNDPACTDPPSTGIVSTATIRSDVPVGSATSVMYVAGGDTKMYALNAATGAVLWSQSVGANPDHFVWSSPAVFGNSVYIGVSSFGDCPLVQGQLVQLDRVTGAVQHTFNTVPDGCIGGGVWGSPTVDEAAGTIYFTTGNDGACGSSEPFAPAIVEVRASDLSVVGSWKVPPAEQGDDSDFGSTPTLFNGVIGGQARGLVGSINKNGVFYAFQRDAIGSGPVWRAQIAVGGGDPNTGNGDVASAAFDGTTLYVGGDITTISGQACNGSVNALNPSTGAFTWRHCFTDGFVVGGVTVTSGGVVAVGEGSHIAVVSAATGASLFTFTGAGPFFGPPSIVNGTLYEGDLSGHLYALTTQ